MSIKYRVWLGRIWRVSIRSETDKMVVTYNGMLKAKRYKSGGYFDTYADAHAYLLAQAEDAVEKANLRLQHAERDLAAVRSMREDNEPS